MIEFGRTERGFEIGRFNDEYGEACSIQKSSLAYPDCIWLGAREILDVPEGGSLNRRMHLTREMASELIEVLQRFVDTGRLTP